MMGSYVHIFDLARENSYVLGPAGLTYYTAVLKTYHLKSDRSIRVSLNMVTVLLEYIHVS